VILLSCGGKPSREACNSPSEFCTKPASIERLFSLMGDTKTKKRNKMKTQKLQRTGQLDDVLCKRHFEPKGNGTNRDQIEDEEIVRAAESGVRQ
jgi:hypothetical protein